MPIYDEISKELLDKWIIDLINQFENLYRNPNQDLLSYLFLRLYEYIQCYSKYYISEQKGQLSNVYITLKDIKTYMPNQNYRNIINNLYNIRNKVGHGNRSLFLNILTFNNTLFYNFLKDFGLPNNFIKLIEKVLILFSNLDTIKLKCLEDCQISLSRIRNTDYKIAQVVKELYSKYPKSFVDNNIVKILSNEYLITN